MLFFYLPALLLMVGGFLFIRYSDKTWNNPLVFVFKNHKKLVNEITGKIWIVGGSCLFLLLVMLGTFLSPMMIGVFYLLTVLGSYIISYFVVQKQIKKK